LRVHSRSRRRGDVLLQRKYATGYFANSCALRPFWPRARSLSPSRSQRHTAAGADERARLLQEIGLLVLSSASRSAPSWGRRKRPSAPRVMVTEWVRDFGRRLTLSITDQGREFLQRLLPAYAHGTVRSSRMSSGIRTSCWSTAEGHGTNAFTGYLVRLQADRSADRTRANPRVDGAGAASRWIYGYTVDVPAVAGSSSHSGWGTSACRSRTDAT